MPKLLQINTVCNAGSTGRIAEHIAEITSAYNWENFVAFGRDSGLSKCANMYKINSKFSLYKNVLQARIFDNDALLNTYNTRKFVAYIDSIKPDIIHLHNLHGYYLDLRILFEYIKTVNIPVVYTLHDCWAFTGHCAYFDFCDCDKWKSLCVDCPQKNAYPKSIFLDNSKRNFLAKKEFISTYPNLHFVPVSDWLADLLSCSIYKNSPKTVIKNGIDLDVFKPSIVDDNFYVKYPFKDKFVILGVASPWGIRKGYDDFLKLSTLFNDDEIAVMVGVNDAQFESIKANFKNIIPIKRTDNIKELVALYSASDVFFNPTYEDNYPTTNMEAQACGTPVVCYRTGGAIETFDTSTGFEISKGDLDSALSAIRQVKASGKASFSKALSAKSKADFDMHKCFEKYYLLYQKTLNC